MVPAKSEDRTSATIALSTASASGALVMLDVVAAFPDSTP
jgi:hypothetical protein